MYQRQIKFKDTVNKVEGFFVGHFPEYKDQIQEIEKMNLGFSNQTFRIKTNDNKNFKVRIADNNHCISRSNEQEIIKIMNDKNLLFYDTKTGDAIYKWIYGQILLNKRESQNKHINSFLTKNYSSFNNVADGLLKMKNYSDSKKPLTFEELKKIYNLSKNFHDSKLPNPCNILVHDDFDYFRFAKSHISQKYQDIYKQLVEKYKDLPKVLCHNDLSEKNIICDENNDFHLIDYEWGRLNTVYWDLGNLIRNSQLNRTQIYELSKIANLSYAILLDFAFIATYYALQFIYAFEKLHKNKEYLTRTFNSLELYLTWKIDNSQMQNNTEKTKKSQILNTKSDETKTSPVKK